MGEIKLFGQTIVLQVKQEEIDKNYDQENNNNNNNDLINKRPDKIIPCPRCKSMETKFCYFNNYNVNQPRHFCKGCQRYWTAGGALRNVRHGGMFAESCLLDGINMDQFDVDGMLMEDWQLAAAMATGATFSHGFQVKRRRSESGQTC